MFLWILIIIAIIVGAFAYIMSQTGMPTNKELDLVDLRVQKYKNEIETLLKTQKKESISMEEELAAMVQMAAPKHDLQPHVDLSIEELPLNAIDP